MKRGGPDGEVSYETRLRDVEADLARLRGAREQMIASTARTQRLLDELTDDLTERCDDDGLATVTCDGAGRILRIVLDSTRYARTDENRLRAAVLEARTRARDCARRAAVEAIRPLSTNRSRRS